MLSRIRQGLFALTAWARPVDFDLAATYLSPALMAVFKKMRRSEQQHSINVLRTLREMGYDQPSLMVAALLHDSGKSRVPFHIWDRVLVVLVHQAIPKRAWQWGKGNPTGWRRPFSVAVQHPQWSAEMASEANADPLAVDLIARHQTRLYYEPRTDADKLLIALQEADKKN